MAEFLPLFPLGMIIFPKETVNLHVFEPRYKQLVNDCLTTKTNFGVPFFIEGKLHKWGAELQIDKVEKVYEDGRMDIKTHAVRNFEWLKFENPYNGKLYAAGDVLFHNHPIDNSTSIKREQITHLLYTITRNIGIPLEINPNESFLVAKIVHKIGLSTEQQLALLKMDTECDRLIFLQKYLDDVLESVLRVQRIRDKVALNGHFKNFNPLDF